ncbi:hypothetical protein UlMin_016075 [Ulmus minor]
MENWTRGTIIGRGSTAAVYLAADHNSGEVFAVKSKLLSSSLLLQKEQFFLSKLSSIRIIKYLGFDISEENNVPIYNLCLEYVSGGSLFDVVQRQEGRLKESLIKFYTFQILQGLEYLHGNGIVHCDIKSRNVLIGEEGVKIADLGCAKWVEEDDFSGTPAFMAPEVARGEEQGFGADIWALGCTIIEMATGNSPWPEMDDPVAALYRIGFSDGLPEFPGWLSETAKDFMGKCLVRNPKERWTAIELLKHPFFEGLDSQTEQVKVNKTSSPISVLDQDLWDSILGSPQEEEFDDSFPNLAAERIKMLIGCTFSLDPNMPNWSWDQDWVTVRCNGDEDEQELESLIYDESAIFEASFSDEEELQSSIFDEELSFDYSLEIISSGESSFVIPCNNIEIVCVSKDLRFERNSNKNFLFSNLKLFLFTCF